MIAGLYPVKVNTVLVRGVNDDEVLDLASFGRERGVEVRFIEFMPLDGAGEWSAERVVPASEIVDRINAVYPLEPAVGGRRSRRRRGAEPADRYRYLDGAGQVGVIASVTRPFCCELRPGPPDSGGVAEELLVRRA